MPIQSHNPATGETLKTFELHTQEQVQKIITQSVNAFAEIRTWSFVKRAQCMQKAADILDAEADRFGAIMTTEMGKTLSSAIAEAKKSAWVCRYYAENAEAILAKDVVESAASQSYRLYLPIGPILAVMPWNYPFWQVFRFAAPALMAGNTGLLKHASNVPQCALEIEDIFKRAGFPAGAFKSLLIGGAEVEPVLRDDRVKAATLTGSEPAGASVASICGQEIKPTVLELGGSDAFIIMPSADLDAAVKIGTTARTQNNGQSCIAAKRYIVHADIYDDVKARFKAAFEALEIGDPMDVGTDIGPIVDAKSRAEISAQVERAVNDGASIVTGAKSLDGPGYYFAPGILEGVPDTSAIYREEIFGPVGILIKIESIEEAISIANDTPFGLGSAIFTNDQTEQDLAIRDLEAGATFVNSMTSSDPRLPFGGIKRSGYGRELSAEGIRAFCNVKTVSIA